MTPPALLNGRAIARRFLELLGTAYFGEYPFVEVSLSDWFLILYAYLVFLSFNLYRRYVYAMRVSF